MLSRLALGTVQFGLPYGIANRGAQTTREEAAAILSAARAAGMQTLDTAIAYGDSERRLGEIGVTSWRVISKLPPLPADRSDVDTWVQESVAGSLQRLRKPALDGLLLHRAADLCETAGARLHAALRALKASGAVRKIGVSIYAPADLDALEGRFELDLVQAPLNVFDRRLVNSGWLSRLADAGVEVHARSIFLQGLLLMPAAERPTRFARWHDAWNRWDAWLADNRTGALAACLAIALSDPRIACLVVGVDSLAQLGELLAAAGGSAPVPPADLASEDAELINPALWGAR